MRRHLGFPGGLPRELWLGVRGLAVGNGGTRAVAAGVAVAGGCGDARSGGTRGLVDFGRHGLAGIGRVKALEEVPELRGQLQVGAEL